MNFSLSLSLSHKGRGNLLNALFNKLLDPNLMEWDYGAYSGMTRGIYDSNTDSNSISKVKQGGNERARKPTQCHR